METVTDFIFLGSKITVNGDCSHEIKMHLLLGKKAMTNLEFVFKGRNITLLTKVHMVKAVESRLPEVTAINSDMQMIPPLWQKAKRS